MTYYSLLSRDWIFVKGYAFLYFAKKFCSKYSQKLLDHAKQSTTYALKTASKRPIQKTAETTGDVIGNKIADKIKKVSNTPPQTNSETNSKCLVKNMYLQI